MLPTQSYSELPTSASTVSTFPSTSAQPSNVSLPHPAPYYHPTETPSNLPSLYSGVSQSVTSLPGANFDHIFHESEHQIPKPAQAPGKPAGPSKSAPTVGGSSVVHVRRSQVIKQPPPIRNLEHHHHHHPIPVDSKTDFKKLEIDENKVNYLPYFPPSAVDQTGLIQAIGKPFNPNHAKYLPDPGDEFMITRRASEVRLKHVKLYGDVNPKVVDGLVATLKLFSFLIGIAGLLFFLFVIGIAALWTPMEFTRYFLDSHPLYKAAYILGVVQPIAVAPYCRYALINLKFIRTYFLRVPLSLVFPTGVVLVGFLMFVETVTASGELHNFLKNRMAYYFKVDHYDFLHAQETWNGIQETFSCCGYESPNDWLAYNTTHFPKSCCETSDCAVGSSDIETLGCSGSYKAVNIILAIIFLSFGGTIGVLEILSVIFMRSLYACIGKELYDERKSLTIMFGRLCSLCEVEDTDVELEYDYKHKEHNTSSSDSDEEHHKRNSKESKGPPSKAASKTTVGDDKPTGPAKTIGAKKVAPAPAGRGKGKPDK